MGGEEPRDADEVDDHDAEEGEDAEAVDRADAGGAPRRRRPRLIDLGAHPALVTAPAAQPASRVDRAGGRR